MSIQSFFPFEETYYQKIRNKFLSSDTPDYEGASREIESILKHIRTTEDFWNFCGSASGFLRRSELGWTGKRYTDFVRSHRLFVKEEDIRNFLCVPLNTPAYKDTRGKARTSFRTVWNVLTTISGTEEFILRILRDKSYIPPRNLFYLLYTYLFLCRIYARIDFDFIFEILQELLKRTDVVYKADIDILVLHFQTLWGAVPSLLWEETLRHIMEKIETLSDTEWISRVSLHKDEVLDRMRSSFKKGENYLRSEWHILDYESDCNDQQILAILDAINFRSSQKNRIDSFLADYAISEYALFKEGRKPRPPQFAEFIADHIQDFPYELMKERLDEVGNGGVFSMELVAMLKQASLEQVLADVRELYQNGYLNKYQLQYLDSTYQKVKDIFHLPQGISFSAIRNGKRKRGKPLLTN